MGIKKILFLLVVLIVASGCIEQPTENNQTNATPLPDEHGGLTEVNYNYVVPVNWSSLVIEEIDEFSYHDVYIKEIGNTNLSFFLSRSSHDISSFRITDVRHGYFGGISHGITYEYFKIAYDENGRPLELNHSSGDEIIFLRNGSKKVFSSGKELEDWNVKLTIYNSDDGLYKSGKFIGLQTTYQINFTVLEPIPTLED